MIKFLVDVVQSIIVAMIFIIIIEMLLPNNSNKKYVKMVAGLYIVFTILNPILSLTNKEIDLNFEKYLNAEEAYTPANTNEFKKYYVDSFCIIVEDNLKKQGYNFLDLKISFNDDYSEITEIEIYGAEYENIENMKKFLFENYGIEIKNINFK